MFLYGTRGRNRTYNNRVKVWCVATTLLGNKILLYKFLRNVVDFSTHGMIVSNGDALVNLFFLYVVNKQHIRKNP
jgi:hypothetical protein